MSGLAYKSEKNSKAIADALQSVLADTYVLYFKTHSFHWNVEGINFKTLHVLFEEQYTELWNATDIIAERIRALGSYGPLSFKDILETGNLQETGQLPDAKEMIIQLANDNEAIVAESLSPALLKAQELGDEATVGMLVDRIEIHEQAAWMLRSTAK